MTMATTMTSIAAAASNKNVVLVIVLLAVLVAAATEGADDTPSLVPSACMAAYAAGDRSFTVEFCTSALNSDGQSAGAKGISELALIAVDLATANATSSKAKIDALLAAAAAGGGAVAEGLRSCQGLYDAVVMLYQPYCHDAVRDRRYGDGRSCLGRSTQAAVECERGFKQRNVASPVAKEDDNLGKLTKLAVALTTNA